ncbi:VOC family protein [Kribbella sp. NBC_00709]|nr:VOC family protein [Kribbella sp. NBC_00709]
MLTVADVDRTIDFYQRVLGMEARKVRSSVLARPDRSSVCTSATPIGT